MRRREFITLIGGAAAAWPLAVSAQQGRLPRIGMLLDGDDDDPTIIAAITALRTGLHALKWIEGQNYRFEHRSTGKVLDRMPAAVTDIVRAAPDVIVVRGMSTALTLRKETTTIPAPSTKRFMLLK